MITKAEAIKYLAELNEFVSGLPDIVRPPKLTLPVNKDGVLSGKPDAHEIKGADLNTYKSEWYWVDEEGSHFIAPGQDEKPALTDNAKYGRTEILDENRFDMNAVYEISKKVKFKAMASKIVFMQIHRGNKAGKSLAPVVKWVGSENGLIRALVKKTEGASDSVLTFTHKWKLDEWFDVSEKYENGKLTLTLNGEVKTIDVDLTGADATYGKWGNYNNSAKGRGHVVIA